MRRLRHHKNTLFAGKLSEPSHAEGEGIASDLAISLGDLLFHKGLPFLAKKGLEAGRYYASELKRNPELQQKAFNYGIRNAQPAIQKVASFLTSCLLL